MSVHVDHEDDGVAVVRFREAERLNSFDPETLARLHAVFKDLLFDPAVRAIVLTGQGKAFCAGADMGAFQAAIGDGDAPRFILDATAVLHPMLLELYTCDKPFVAAVNGVAAGGGLGLALAADARIGSPHARFAASYFRIGASPDGGATWLLPRLIGESRTRRFFFDNEVMDADEALRAGLLDRVVEPDRLVAEAVETARRWGAWSAHSRGATKKLLAMAKHNDFATQLEAERGLIAAGSGTGDFREGVAAFLEKRAPRFH